MTPFLGPASQDPQKPEMAPAGIHIYRAQPLRQQVGQRRARVGSQGSDVNMCKYASGWVPCGNSTVIS